jgi:peptidoglycan hydrolase CwlO-like protein
MNMTLEEARAALANQNQLIANQQATLATIQSQRKDLTGELQRLKDGDDLRQVLIESCQRRLGRLDEIIAQTEEQIRHMETAIKHIRNAIEG